jgi:saccharopine dehydrogenase-like NADP-dependent oxidoreductase
VPAKWREAGSSKGSNGSGLRVVLAGRSATKGKLAVEEVERTVGGAEALAARGHLLSFAELDYTDPEALQTLLSGGGQDERDAAYFDACVHTAGPFFHGPAVLRACIKAGTKVTCPACVHQSAVLRASIKAGTKLPIPF